MTTTLDLAARFVPLPRAEREALLARLPEGRGHVSQLHDCFGGTWYLHRGDLTVDGDLDSTLNLVVDGDLTVRGTLTDDSGEALLVVTGDLRAGNVLSRQLLVVLGSLLATGVVHADYNDWCFEVWGDSLHARALVVSDRSVLLPEARTVELEFDGELAEVSGDPAATLVPGLVRFVDEGGNALRRAAGGKGWIGEDGEPLGADDARAVRIERVVPADFEAFVEEIRAGRPVLRSSEEVSVPEPGSWRLDREADSRLVAAKARSADPRDRAAAASHPAATPHLLARLAADPEPRVRAALAHHPALGSESAAALAKDADPDVRRQLVASVHAGPHLAALVGDPSPEVRRAIASHPSLDDERRRLLLADPEKPVRARALRYLPVTAAWVNELRGAEDEQLSAWALEHADEVAEAGGEAAAPADWREGLLDTRPAVREAALRVSRDPLVLPFLSEHRDRYVDDPSPAVRRALASATRDAATLTALAADTDEYVRRFALENLAVPSSLLVAAAGRIAASGPTSWWTSDPRYMDQMTSTQELLAHPRLPAEALRTIHRAYPRAFRLEPRREMPLDVILERAESLTPSLAFEERFVAWRTAGERDGDPGEVFAELLRSDNSYLQAAARMSSLVPIEALLAHAHAVQDDSYALGEIAANALLGGTSAAVEELRLLLIGAAESDVDRALARNPDLPARVLRRLLERVPDDVTRTLWQAHGETP